MFLRRHTYTKDRFCAVSTVDLHLNEESFRGLLTDIASRNLILSVLKILRDETFECLKNSMNLNILRYENIPQTLFLIGNFFF